MKDYYHTCCRQYHEKTFHVDPESFLMPLVKKLKPGARILDIGCGSGRDLLWMKQRGFRVIGFERSPGLADLARENSGCDIIKGDFDSYDFSQFQVDALILIGALVHVPHEKLSDMLCKVLKAVRPDGHLLVTLKQGKGKKESPDGRIFYLWQDAELRRIFTKLKCRVSEYFVQVSDIAEDDIWLGYVLEKKC
jgi:cyclopropane fatty-acyl-phospholipid synthase-like methyltransferase